MVSVSKLVFYAQSTSGFRSGVQMHSDLLPCSFFFLTLCTICDISSWLADPCICFVLETYACPCFTDVNPNVFSALGWKELLANAVG